jgi:hypothetical protein
MPRVVLPHRAVDSAMMSKGALLILQRELRFITGVTGGMNAQKSFAGTDEFQLTRRFYK